MSCLGLPHQRQEGTVLQSKRFLFVVSQMIQPILSKIRSENTLSAMITKYAGVEFGPEVDGMLSHKRKPLK